MEFLDEIFKDLINDLNKWNRRNSYDDSIVNRLEDLKETLQSRIDEINTEIKYQQQNKPNEYIDRVIDEKRIEKYKC